MAARVEVTPATDRRSARTGMQLTDAERATLVEFAGMYVDAELDAADGAGEDRTTEKRKAIAIAVRQLAPFGVTRTDVEMYCKRFKIS